MQHGVFPLSIRLMMALRGVNTLLLAVIWIRLSSSTLGIHQFNARIRVKSENAAFLRFNISAGNLNDNLTLVHDPNSEHIYVGGPHSLYILNQTSHPVLEKVQMPTFHFECQSRAADCEYKITLLKKGRNGNPLFVCGTTTKTTECCDMSLDGPLTSCFNLKDPTEINQPSVHAGDSLYYTISSGSKDQSNPVGLYRWNRERHTWPTFRKPEQRYVKILTNKRNGTLDGKVYTFYIEQNLDLDPNTPVWIPQVSQICMADRGGSKAVLQFRWTSMLTARLFCGDEKKHLSYTELLDVAVLEAAEWENTTIYALFKNAYNLRAVCIYRMADIIHVFNSNKFRASTETFSSPRPGECVEDSCKLPSNNLMFMEKNPEMQQWIKPARDALLFHHHHYTHLLVDRVKSSTSGHHTVLLMSLENGSIHKVLEQDGDDKPFIITEYEPFKMATHISSMLLDSKAKKLYVSSSREVIQIDLQNCSVYGKSCELCVMARDPYCGWDAPECSAITNTQGALIQDVTHGNHSICETNFPKASKVQMNGKSDPFSIANEDSKHYLKCPMESQHASYGWEHEGRRRECVSAEQDCLLLIDSMSEKDEGDYVCVASENGYDRTIVHQKLQMNSASETRTCHLALACLLFLLYIIC